MHHKELNHFWIPIKTIIQDSINIKSNILSYDPQEKKYGLILEYGHTIGHALELVTNGIVNHGEGVSIGILVAGEISNMMGHFTENDVTLQKKLLHKIGIIDILKNKKLYLSKKDILKYIHNDNKRGYLNNITDNPMVIMDKFGTPLKYADTYIVPISDKMISVALDIIAQELNITLE